MSAPRALTRAPATQQVAAVELIREDASEGSGEGRGSPSPPHRTSNAADPKSRTSVSRLSVPSRPSRAAEEDLPGRSQR